MASKWQDHFDKSCTPSVLLSLAVTHPNFSGDLLIQELSVYQESISRHGHVTSVVELSENNFLVERCFALNIILFYDFDLHQNKFSDSFHQFCKSQTKIVHALKR